MLRLMPYERENIRRLSPYVPGDQPQGRSVVKLNTNENPYPPCNAVIESIRTVDAEALRRYPQPQAARFRETAAEVHGLVPGQVIATNGGDELLRLAVTACCAPDPGGGICIAEPGYELYRVIAAIHDTPVHGVPLTEDFGLPDDFARSALEAGSSLAIIINPHAPSGRLETLEKLHDLARELLGRAVLLIDEAYVDFSSRDALPLVRRDSGLDNVLLLRSLSKGYGLAGLRFGYGLGHPGLIAALDKARDSYNTDVLSQVAATAALEHRGEAARTWRAVQDERRRVGEALRARDFNVLPSEANFILVRPPAGGGRPSAAEIFTRLKNKSIYVRYFDRDRLRERLRITIGTPAENDRLLAALNPG
jgi:histidinol-phosphate aminotransferase